MAYTVEQFRIDLAAGQWAWPGGYPKYFVAADGEALSFEAARENQRLVEQAIEDEDRRNGWCVVGVDVNWEDPNLYCAHTNERIQSAYAEGRLTCEPPHDLSTLFPPDWTPQRATQAKCEGWALFQFAGHIVVDSHQYGADIAADIVMAGEQEHHKAARQIIHRESAHEWARMLERVACRGLQRA